MENSKDYYKAYDKRYSQVHGNGMLWSTKDVTPDVLESIANYAISTNDKILDLGCGEGRDAIHLLNKGYSVLGVDYSNSAIKKCKELSSHKYDNSFKQFDLLKDKMLEKFNYIYSIAVLHMFVLEEHRDKFLTFIQEHLTDNGRCLICVLGDGYKEYSSNIEEAFNDKERTVMNNNISLKLATTSCKIVNWQNFEKEIDKNNLVLERKWISTNVPEFSSCMCVILKKKI